MKRIAVLLVFGILGLVPIARAQDHAEVGAFVDYFRLHDTSTNLIGVGGRAAINVNPWVGIEAEMAYDFNQAFNETFTGPGGTGTSTTTVTNSNVKLLHGLFGPKVQTKGPVKVFVTVKGGFTDFMFNSAPGSFSSFTSSVSNLRTNNVNAVLYPGGGIEGFFGPIGLRAEVGDEMYFAGGAHHNLRVTFGPVIRF